MLNIDADNFALPNRGLLSPCLASVLGFLAWLGLKQRTDMMKALIATDLPEPVEPTMSQMGHGIKLCGDDAGI